MKEFEEEGLYTKNLEQQVEVSMRKMFYDDELNIFDNEQLIHKKVLINPEPSRLMEKNYLFLRIEKEGYDTLEIDIYDNTIKQRLKLVIEISLRKLEFLDQDRGRYVVKIPPYFWKINPLK